MFKFKVFKHISFDFFLELWMSIFGVSYSSYSDWLSSRLSSIILIGVDTENFKINNEAIVYIVWVPSVISISYISDWYTYQVDQFAIYAKDKIYFDYIIRSDLETLTYDIINTNSGNNNDIRIGNQIKYILDYISNLNFDRFIDLGSGDSDLSLHLRDILKEKYLPLDPKLGHSYKYINIVLSSSKNDLVIMRNSLHHFNSLEMLHSINSKYIIIIDYFGCATSFVSIYHFIYKELFICWDINSIRYHLRRYNFFKLLDAEVNKYGPTGYIFTKIYNGINLENMYSNDLLLNFYDMQMLNDDMSVSKFDIYKLKIKDGMLRGLVDYFFNFRLPFKISDFNDKISYLNEVREFSKNNIEVKPDDIYLWIKIFREIDSNVCDPFSGWCSRLLAFSILRWFDDKSSFYWFDFDNVKCDAANKLISYLNESGCKVNFIYMSDSRIIPHDVIIATSPFYMNFEPMYGSKSATFNNTDDWANYIIGFINQKCKRLYPSIIQMNNYKGYNLSNQLFSRLPDGSEFSLMNDLGYFRFKVYFKSIIYSQLDITSFTFGISNRFELNLILKSNNDFMYKYKLMNSELEMINNLVSPNCSINDCGHFGYQNEYIDGVTIYSGQLKLLNLLINLSTLGYTYIIYAGSGNGFSVLTDFAIEYLALTKGITFLLLDKYTIVPKTLQHTNIIVPNKFLTNDNFNEILNLVKVGTDDKILLLSDVRSLKDVPEYEYNVRRANEFYQEVQLYNSIIDHFLKMNVTIDTCLKINYSPITYMIPDEGLFMPIGITGEFRVLIENKRINCNLEMSSELFDVLLSNLLIQQFTDQSRKCAYCNFFDSLNI